MKTFYKFLTANIYSQKMNRKKKYYENAAPISNVQNEKQLMEIQKPIAIPVTQIPQSAPVSKNDPVSNLDSDNVGLIIISATLIILVGLAAYANKN